MPSPGTATMVDLVVFARLFCVRSCAKDCQRIVLRHCVSLVMSRLSLTAHTSGKNQHMYRSSCHAVRYRDIAAGAVQTIHGFNGGTYRVDVRDGVRMPVHG